MKITFIIASVGKQCKNHYVRSWMMEPLSIAMLSALTPSFIHRTFYDDRFEDIPFDEPTDLVAINVETYTAARAYQIAHAYRQRNVKVVLGGFHPTLVPEEAAEHADAVLLGEAEDIWSEILDDFRSGKLKKFYQKNTFNPELKDVIPDRSIFKNKSYPGLRLVETGRGCPFNCEFCSITHFFKKRYKTKPIPTIIKEIRQLKSKLVFFVDDNIGSDPQRAKELFRALRPLKIKWMSQVSMNICRDEELLDLMKKSGCQGALIGFESLNPHTIAKMGKQSNATYANYARVIQQFHKYQMGIYATFIMGYQDTERDFERIYEFGLKNKILYLAFNHLMPFPGTNLYQRLEREGRLLYDKWWLEPGYRFGDLVFRPDHISPEELTNLCLKYRYKYFQFSSIAKRLIHPMYCFNPTLLFSFLLLNLSANVETTARRNLIIGGHTQDQKPRFNPELQLTEAL